MYKKGRAISDPAFNDSRITPSGFVAAELYPDVVVQTAELSPEDAVLTAGLSPEDAVLSAELSPEAAVLTAGLSPGATVLTAELYPDVVVQTAELSPEVAVLTAEPVLVSESGVVFVAVSVADVAEPLDSVDIAVACAVLAPVSAVVVEVVALDAPRFLPFPMSIIMPRLPVPLKIGGDQSVHSATGARTNYGPCSILSNLGLHHNKNLEHCYNNPSPGYNTVSDTNHPAMDATTSHSRKTSLHLSQEQRKHWAHQVAQSHPVVRQM